MDTFSLESLKEDRLYLKIHQDSFIHKRLLPLFDRTLELIHAVDTSAFIKQNDLFTRWGFGSKVSS